MSGDADFGKAVAAPKGARKVYPTKEKTPEELEQWRKFVTNVNNASTSEEVLKSLLDYEIVDNGQAAFAFNRAKKMMESVGLLLEDKWREKKYRSMGTLKVQFFSEIYKITNESTIAALKRAIVTPTTSKGKIVILYGEEEGSAILGNQAHSNSDTASHNVLPPSSSSSADIPTVGRGSVCRAPGDLVGKEANIPKKRRKVDDSISITAAVGFSAQAESSEITSTQQSSALTPIELEILRKLRSDRLAVAMVHPSFQLLTKQQQQLVKDQWMEMLVGSK